VKAPDFSYHDPRTLADLMGLLARLDEAKLLAGGQSLMPMLNLRLLAPEHVIDINRIPELAGIRIADGMVEIGAMTRQADLLASDELARTAPIFRKALTHVGHVQTRARGTIGGSCCHLDPAAEQPALCALLDAEFDVIGPDGARTVAAADWFQGYLQSALDERELLRAIRWRSWPQGHGTGFEEYARRRGDFAIAGAAALLDTADDRSIRRAAIVVFGVEPSPVRLAKAEQSLVGCKLDRAAIEMAIDEARVLDAMSDAHVSADYRLHLAGVVTRRALSEAGHLVEVPA
jgi:aerobic carbon-monoxide dehydrogenase medium subunit